jgi:hypothetical protein
LFGIDRRDNAVTFKSEHALYGLQWVALSSHHQER